MDEAAFFAIGIAIEYLFAIIVLRKQGFQYFGHGYAQRVGVFCKCIGNGIACFLTQFFQIFAGNDNEEIAIAFVVQSAVVR